MLLEKDVKRLFQQLLLDKEVHFQMDGSSVGLRIFDHASKLSLSTVIYNGGNYIPRSVRNSLSQTPPDNLGYERVKTYLTVDEVNFRIFLNYLDTLDHLNNESLRILLDDFSWIAESWRRYLDENDKQDLIHVRVK